MSWSWRLASRLLQRRAYSVPLQRTPLANSASADKSAVTPASVPLVVEEQGAGMKAIQQAAADKKYLFAFFWNNDNEQTAAMRGVFDQAIAKVTDRAQAVAVRVSDPAERGIVKKFEVDRAPMPLVLAIAPNGAVMGGFPTKFEENDLLAAFSSPCTEQCIKSLQDGKLVLVCVQNGSTKFNEEALRGVNEFKADEKFGSATEVVMLDPADSAETSFLGDLKIDAKTTVAKTAFIAPSGALIAEYEGATTKDELMAALQQANSRAVDRAAVDPVAAASAHPSSLRLNLIPQLPGISHVNGSRRSREESLFMEDAHDETNDGRLVDPDSSLRCVGCQLKTDADPTVQRFVSP